MKKVSLLYFIPALFGMILLFAFSADSPAQTPQYYNYQQVGASNNSFPFGQAAGKGVQWLFLPGDFNQPTPVPAGNNITKIYYWVSGAGTRTYTDLVVLMAKDTTTLFPSGTFYSGPMDTVYYKASVSLTGTLNSWMEIVLDRPYAYDPAKSLIVFVGQCGGAGTGINILQNAIGVGRRTWSVGGCPFTPYAGGDGSIANFGITVAAAGNALPDLLYYKFKNNTAGFTPNFAVPGVGTNPAPFIGSVTSGGQFDSALIGTGVAGAGVTPGWSLNVGSSSWTISMWVSIPTSTSGSAFYLFGDPGSGTFRCFHNGVALQNNLILRGTGITDVTVTGIGPAPTVVHFVYDSAAANIKSFKNGVLFSTIAQTPLNIATGTGFRVGGYSTSANFMGLFDEFRFYKRALNEAEITATWNQNLGVATGVTPITSVVPDKYTLSQNYPNPFNPTTKINFSLPKSGLVTLKIFDVLGREVSILINEVKNAGSYSVDFNASSLSSGMYYYRLESNGFMDTKKMMFVK